MKGHPVIVLGFNTSHPRGLTEIAGHTTKTEICFTDEWGKITRLVKQMGSADRNRKQARTDRLWSQGLARLFWNRREAGYTDRKDRLLERARRTMCALLEKRPLELTSASQPITISSCTSEGFRRAEAYELRDLAEDLKKGEHLWFMIHKL